MAPMSARFQVVRQPLDWLRRFFTRNPEVRTKIGTGIDALRARNASAVDLNAWLTLFQTTLTGNRIAVKEVWNV